MWSYHDGQSGARENQSIDRNSRLVVVTRRVVLVSHRNCHTATLNATLFSLGSVVTTVTGMLIRIIKILLSYSNKVLCAVGVTIVVFCYLRYAFPPPVTFWYVEPANRSIPMPQPMELNVKLSLIKNCSLIIAACARNVETHLPGFRSNIEHIASLFSQYFIFIGESDSTDRTLMYLQQWRDQNKQVTVKTYGNLSRTIAERSVRIATCRNGLLEEVRRLDLNRTSRKTFLLVADVDANARLRESVFLSNFDYALNQWDGMTASQYGGYYDIWALRTSIVNYDCWRIVKNILIILRTLNRAVYTYVSIHQKPIPANHSLIPVDSAFGGGALYQMKYLNGCTYSGFRSHRLCEHVEFNLCFTKNGGQLFINPKFQIN